jgi:hypothetical protein
LKLRDQSDHLAINYGDILGLVKRLVFFGKDEVWTLVRVVRNFVTIDKRLGNERETLAQDERMNV